MGAHRGHADLPRPTEPRIPLSTDDDDARVLLASRLATFILVMLAIRVSAILVLTLTEWLLETPKPWISRGSGGIGVVATVTLLGIVVLLKRVRLSLGWLRGVDAAVTLSLASAAALSIPIEGAPGGTDNPMFAATREAHELKALLVLAHLLLLRAALIPSAPRRTALLGVLASSILAAATWVAASRSPELARPLPFVNALVWSSFSVVVSTACSKVIFGLRRNVRQALRLGQYTLEEKLGEGGMGIVYRASHALLRRPTAIKMLSSSPSGEGALARFEREVQLTAGLSHPNIVSVYDFGRAQDGSFYYAMEYIDGIDLQRLVDDDGPLPPGRVLRVLTQAAEALAEAHAVGLVHRDIKPANMILTERASESDVLKLVDFGLVKRVAADDTQELSGTHELRGTPLYMAPEVILDPNNVGPACDLYALGAVGYFLLTGRPVFKGDSAIVVLGKHAHADPEPPSTHVTGVPERLECVILRCLLKDPTQRYSTARELEQALEECDDTPVWSEGEARGWWQQRKPVERTRDASSPFDATLAVDWARRAPAA